MVLESPMPFVLCIVLVLQPIDRFFTIVFDPPMPSFLITVVSCANATVPIRVAPKTAIRVLMGVLGVNRTSPERIRSSLRSALHGRYEIYAQRCMSVIVTRTAEHTARIVL